MADRALTLRLADQVAPAGTNYQGYTLPASARNVCVQVLTVTGKFAWDVADNAAPASNFITLQPNTLYRFPVRDGTKQGASGARFGVAVATAGNTIEVLVEE